ncbi:MAG: PEP-CTERM sorting domain-containing protein [Bryobacteraceae bacterium]
MTRRIGWIWAFLTTSFVVSPFSLSAGVVTLTFEGLQNTETVGDYYNGGFGGNGSGPGPDYGITFGGSALALISVVGTYGGSGNFDLAPTMPTILFFSSGSGAIMNVAAGFTTGFSFYYASPYALGSVTVYDGLNGTGDVLETLTLPETPASSTDPSCQAAYCPWEPIGVSFDGTALSVDFSGGADNIGFDNITLGASTPTGSESAPEPATWGLIVSGLTGVILARSRHRAW